jgi:lysophospholipase L1-like esterase
MNPQELQLARPRPDTSARSEPSQSGSRAAELAVVIFFLMCLASVLVIQTTVELRADGQIRALEVFRQKPTSANLRAYEHSLEHASIVARALRPWFQFAQFVWLKDGGEKALVGREGWMFYKPGFDDMVARKETPNTPTNDPVAAMVAFRDELEARDIHLLVVPVPNKESVYPDLVSHRMVDRRGVLSPATRDVLERLKAAKVEWVNLFEAFGETRARAQSGNAPGLYLAQDSHWSPAGMALAAKKVAQRLVDLGWAGPGPSGYGERPAPVERLGDVLRMMQSPLLERRATAERVNCIQIVRSGTGQPYQDDTNSNVLVLGDSFLRIYEQDEPRSAGFIAHLARELKQPLSSLVNDGGASTLVRQELYRRPGLLRKKRVVIWEFVERDIRLGTEGWQAVPLPPPKKDGGDAVSARRPSETRDGANLDGRR